MHNRHIIFIILFACFLITYPGNYVYGDLFAYHKPEVKQTSVALLPVPHTPVPYVKNGTIPIISAQGAYIVELDSFTPLFQANSHVHFLPASTTKIITALVAVKAYHLDDVVRIQQVHNEGQVMGLQPGERITFQNLLYGLLIFSGNDAAYAIAENYPKGYDQFIRDMNAEAATLHMNDSSFKNPAGLDSPDQYSSPFDLALAGRELLKNETLSNIVSIKSITISDVDFTVFHPLTNVNQLLGEIPGIGGLKTGYTEEAGQNLVTFYKKNGHHYLIVVLKSVDRFEDTRQIVTWIDSSISYAPL